MMQRLWDDIEPGEHLPTVVDPLDFTRVAAAPAATLDWYPLHHDPSFAQAAGQPGIVMSTLQLMGLVDRAVTEWAGPATFIRRRDIRLRHSVFATDVLSCTSTVREKHSEPDSHGFQGLVDLDIEITNGQGIVCCSSSVTIVVPTAAQSANMETSPPRP